MGFIGIFLKPRKYDFRSGYLSDREKTMMDRVHKVCVEQGIDENNVIKTSTLKESIESHRISNNTDSNRSNFRFIIVLCLILIIAFIIIYCFSSLA